MEIVNIGTNWNRINPNFSESFRKGSWAWKWMLHITSFTNQPWIATRLRIGNVFHFPGGVADAIYQDSATNDFAYGDIGIILGRAIRQSKIFEQKRVI